VDALRRSEHEELSALESALATGAGGGARATLTALAADKRARLDGPDDG
jgi:shikimate 5-dehydrogenase